MEMGAEVFWHHGQTFAFLTQLVLALYEALVVSWFLWQKNRNIIKIRCLKKRLLLIFTEVVFAMKCFFSVFLPMIQIAWRG